MCNNILLKRKFMITEMINTLFLYTKITYTIYKQLIAGFSQLFMIVINNILKKHFKERL